MLIGETMGSRRVAAWLLRKRALVAAPGEGRSARSRRTLTWHAPPPPEVQEGVSVHHWEGEDNFLSSAWPGR